MANTQARGKLVIEYGDLEFTDVSVHNAPCPPGKDTVQRLFDASGVFEASILAPGPRLLAKLVYGITVDGMVTYACIDLGDGGPAAQEYEDCELRIILADLFDKQFVVDNVKAHLRDIFPRLRLKLYAGKVIKTKIPVYLSGEFMLGIVGNLVIRHHVTADGHIGEILEMSVDKRLTKISHKVLDSYVRDDIKSVVEGYLR